MTTDPKQPEAQEAPASEREAFEKYARGRFDSIVRASNGPYVWDDVQDAWHTWQARAALGKQPTQERPVIVYHDELSRDEDGDISLDWRTKKNAMLTISISTGGRITWASRNADGKSASGEIPGSATWHPILAAVLDEADAAFASAQEAPADAKDAARYRYLRRLTSAGASMPGCTVQFRFPQVPPQGNLMRGSVAQHLDAAIDSALQSHQEGK